MNKKIVAIDFDGVIHRYSKGWRDGSCYDRPMPGAKAAIKKLMKRYTVVILTARKTKTHYKVRAWLRKWGFPKIKVTNIKPMAVFYLDDKAIRFTSWSKLKKVS